MMKCMEKGTCDELMAKEGEFLSVEIHAIGGDINNGEFTKRD
jgi:hypothetical protein